MNTETTDPIEQITQRVVPAAAGGVRTTAPNSVFAVGGSAGQAGDADADAQPGDLPWRERAEKSFEACGELSCVQLQEALGCSRSRATALIVELREAGVITQVRKDGVVPLYGRPQAGTAATGFKAWLGRQAEQSATPAAGKPAAKRRSRKPKAMPPPTAAPQPKATRRPRKARPAAAPAPAAALPAVVPAVATHLVTPITPPPDHMALGFYDTGEISIEADGQVLRLNPARARKLLAWALRVDALMSVGI